LLPGIPLGWLSAHPFENVSCLLKRLLYHCNKFDQGVYGAVENAVVDAVFEKLHYSRFVHERVNLWVMKPRNEALSQINVVPGLQRNLHWT
jgi:hypothetical protein